MGETIQGDRRKAMAGAVAGRFRVAAAILALATLAGCDTISDAASGTGQAIQGAGDWVSGLFGDSSGPNDQPAAVPPAPAEQPKLGNDERPTPPDATQRQQIAEGLVADNANAQYTEAEQKRMGDETRPLNPQPAASAPASAPAPAPQGAAPQPPAAPAKTLASSSDLPKPSQVAAPPAPVAANPAPMRMASADTTAPRPMASGGDVVGSTYRERLAEFASASAAPATQAAPATRTAYVAPPPAPADTEMAASGGVTAVHGSGGAHPLSALDTSKAAASFQVAQIAFPEGTADLPAGGGDALQSVLEVYRAGKGSARIAIVGHSNSSRLDVSAVANRESNRSLAAERAGAVARYLEKMGVPASKIYAGAAGEGAGDYADVSVYY